MNYENALYKKINHNCSLYEDWEKLLQFLCENDSVHDVKNNKKYI